MRPLLRIRRDLLDAIHADLSRPHPFAAERVGFLYCRCARSASSCLSLATDYVPVADGDYIRDAWVGARIGGGAIRAAMQRVLDTGAGAFHVHRHEHRGSPWFSNIDLRGLAELVPPFAAVGPDAVHGGMVLSIDDLSTITWVGGAKAPVAGLASVVGYPTLIRRGWRDGL